MTQTTNKTSPIFDSFSTFSINELIKQGPDASKLSPERYAKYIEFLHKIQNGEYIDDFTFEYPKSKEDAEKWKYKYWNTQPVPKLGENQSIVKIIDPDIASKSTTQAAMLAPYSWTDFDLSNDRDMDNVCTFLNKNYKLDNKDHFRLYYTKEYIRWSLGDKSRIIGISSNGIIGGIIAASIRNCQIFDKVLQMADVNYFCIHAKLQEKGLAQMFINEITRIMCIENVVVGSFTTQRYIPTPISRIEFYHRPLNYEKLHQVNFIRLENNMSLDKAVSTFMIRYKHKYKVVKMSAEHYDRVYELLCKYQDKYNYYQIYSKDEFIKSFSNSDIVSSYVILDDASDDNTDLLDFYSYYKLPYYVVASETQKNIPKFIKSAYLHMYTSLNATQLTIFKSAILSAYDEGYDVFTSTDIMENIDVLFDNISKFSKGTGYLYYNFYNLTCPEIFPQQICKITL